MKKRVVKKIKSYIVITAASFLCAVGISIFLEPNHLAPGGVSGISIILSRLTGVETGTLILLLNIPLFLLGIWKLGWKLIIPTIYAVVMSSTFTNLLSLWGPVTKEPFLAAMAGASLMAVGIGMVFRAGGTTGGMDIVVKVLRLKYPHVKTSALFLALDIAVVACSGIVFGNIETALYAFVAAMITSRVLDVVLYGSDGAKLIYIISSAYKEIADRIMEEIDIGVTYLEGAGGFSNRNVKVIMCVTRKQQVPRIEEVVKEEDPHVFMIITSATEIYGEGYKNIFAEKM